MSIDTPALAAGGIAPTAGGAEPAESTAQGAWVETAVAIGFAVAAVLFVSFVAVMTSLV
jgi:hypothetical protein